MPNDIRAGRLSNMVDSMPRMGTRADVRISELAQVDMARAEELFAGVSLNPFDDNPWASLTRDPNNLNALTHRWNLMTTDQRREADGLKQQIEEKIFIALEEGTII